jgi:competence protein ComEC
VTAIPAPGPWVLPLLTLGALWLILWPTRARLAGVLPVLASLALWLTAERPLLLISGDGKLVGLEAPGGRVLSAATGGGFAAESWLENDGDLAGQAAAAARDGFSGPRGERWFQVAGLRAVALSGKAAAAKLGPSCAGADLVILAGVAEAAPPGCALIDGTVLAATGPLALSAEAGGLRLTATRSGQRLWSPPARAVTLPDLRQGRAGWDQ